MTREQAFQKIKKLQMPALMRACEIVLPMIKLKIPAGDTGALKNTTRIEAGETSVDLVSGGRGSDAAPYAHYQYATAEQHLVRGGALAKMTSIISGEASGQGDKKRYSVAYRKAVSQNLLTRFPGGLRWFAVFMTDEKNLRMMRTVYARAIL